MNKGEKELLKIRLKNLRDLLTEDILDKKFFCILEQDIANPKNRFTNWKFRIEEFHHTKDEGQRFDISLNDELIIQNLNDGAKKSIPFLHLIGKYCLWEDLKFDRGIMAYHDLINDISKKLSEQ